VIDNGGPAPRLRATMETETETETETEITPPPQPLPEEDLEALRAQAAKVEEISRAYAEVLNDREAFRRRLEREKERQVEAAKAHAAQILLDTMDDLRRARSHAESEPQALAEGIHLIAEGLQRRLEAEGLVPIETHGRMFDPLVHEAVDLVPTTDREADGWVIEEVRGGWRMGEKVIRPARVRVARFVPAEPGS